jgi:hypothetical protein
MLTPGGFEGKRAPCPDVEHRTLDAKDTPAIDPKQKNNDAQKSCFGFMGRVSFRGRAKMQRRLFLVGTTLLVGMAACSGDDNAANGGADAARDSGDASSSVDATSSSDAESDQSVQDATAPDAADANVPDIEAGQQPDASDGSVASDADAGGGDDASDAGADVQALGYAASAAQGDFAVWTIAGGTFTIEWTVTDGTGGVAAIYDVAGTCTSPDVTYGYRDCTVTSSTLVGGPVPRDGGADADAGADGGAISGPSVGDEYYVLDLPGVAMVAHPKGTLGDLRHNLHIGLALGSCDAIDGGTFNFNVVRAGVPGNIDQLLGRFTVTIDGQGVVSSVDAWDYGLLVNGASSTNSSTDPVRIALMTPTSIPHPETITGATCQNGILHVPVNGNNTLRGAVTQSGAVLFDLPHRPGFVNGTGGLIGVVAGSAASIADLEGKQYDAVLFSEGSRVDLVNSTVTDGGALTITSTLNGTVPNNTSLGIVTALTDSALSTFASNLVDITNPLDGGTYGVNAAFGAPAGSRASAPLPSTFAGVAITTNGAGKFADPEGRAMVAITHKAPNGHVMVAGSHFGVNNSDGGASRCFGGTSLTGNEQQYCIDGEFVAFSR